jgi:hypothetical protein
VKIARTSSGCETSTIGASAHAVRSVNGSPYRAAQRRRKAVGRATHSAVWTARERRGPGGSMPTIVADRASFRSRARYRRMESSPRRRRLGRFAPALLLAIPLLAVAVLFGATSAGGQQTLPQGGVVTSDRVTFIRNFPEASDGVGARVVGNRLFVTTTKDLLVYDISNPTNPVRLGGINANIEFENEEVPTNGKLLGISGEINGCTPPGSPRRRRSSTRRAFRPTA